MADIELVIKVPEEDYLTFSKLSEKEKVNELTYYEKMIAYGTPIPKGHGRLIDAGDIHNHIIGHVDTRSCPTIIEADKEGK